jgi:hypothetical protein
MTFFIRRSYYGELAYFALNFNTRKDFELECKNLQGYYHNILEVPKRCFIKMFGEKYRIDYPYRHPKTIIINTFIGFTGGGDLSGGS